MFEIHPIFIVSCQAEESDPFNNIEGIVNMAIAAEMGGAHGIRCEGIEKTKCVINKVKIPVVGLVKGFFKDKFVRITRCINEIEGLLDVGCEILAIDGTTRIYENRNGPELIRMVKGKYKCLILADVSNCKEAVECANAGADFVSTTLYGYTPDTIKDSFLEPNYKLIKKMSALGLKIPIFAEGRIWTPKQAEKIISFGANGIVVGTAITRPRVITKHFLDIFKL